MRVDRVERELEYLENKIPSQSDIEMEEALLRQQIKAAELDQQKIKAKIKVGKGRKRTCTVKHISATSSSVPTAGCVCQLDFGIVCLVGLYVRAVE